MNSPDMLSVKEVAALLECSEATIYRLIESGKVTAYRLGSSYRIDRAGLLKELAYRPTEGSNEQ